MALHCPHCRKLVPMALRRKVAREERLRSVSEAGKARAEGHDMAALGRLGGLAARGKSGRPPSGAPRCACGKYTQATAKKRNHKC